MAGAVASVALAAEARAGTPYVGIEGGALIGRDNDIDVVVDYTTSQTPAAPSAPAGPADVEFDDVFNLKYKTGYDVDAVAGYDFGFFRLELELGYKRAGFEGIEPDETLDSLTSSLNTALNRPSAAPDPGVPGLPALTAGDFDVDGKIGVLSAMANGMVELEVIDRLSIFAGGGYGRAQAKALGDKDSAWAWQYMIGFRYAISPKVELGLKHRYFNSGIVKLRDRNGVAHVGNANRIDVTPPGGPTTTVNQATDARLFPELEGEFRTRSFLVSLFYNF